MMKQRSKISLRSKLVMLLAILPIAFLALYLIMATNLFVEDKKAYIFDSSVSMASSLSSQIKMEINSYKRVAHPIWEAIDYSQLKFSPRSVSFFQAQEHIEHFFIYKRNPGKKDDYSINDHLVVKRAEVKRPNLDPAGMDLMKKITLETGFMISDYKAQSRFFIIMQSHFPKKDPRHHITMAIYKAPEVYEAFATPTVYKSFLISRNRFIAMRPKFVRSSRDKVQIASFDFFDTIVTQKLPEGTAEVQTEKGHPTLVSFSEVGIGDLMVVAVVDKVAALKAVDSLISKSFLFFIAIICVAILISIVSSIGLTSTISKLMEATEQIGSGNFIIDLKLNSRDEFGELAQRFKTMAEKVASLLRDTAEKARMENELEMVRVVQENLFPTPTLEVGPLKVVSHFEPASECGGDWFHYSEQNGKIYLWIGDATGHGAPAALITGAAKSASAIIETSPSITAGQALQVLNHALHSTAHGSILMTFFLGIIDLKTGTMNYANASHEFPYLIPNRKGLKKKDLNPLCDCKQGRRLGEEPETEYNEGNYQLQDGDTILFYTDGIIDLRNTDDVEMGERGFIKAILTANEKSSHINGKVDAFKKILKDYRGSAVLVDDVTMFWIQYKNAS